MNKRKEQPNILQQDLKAASVRRTSQLHVLALLRRVIIRTDRDHKTKWLPVLQFRKLFLKEYYSSHNIYATELYHVCCAFGFSSFLRQPPRRLLRSRIFVIVQRFRH